jgi:hypothetical protein
MQELCGCGNFPSDFQGRAGKKKKPAADLEPMLGPPDRPSGGVGVKLPRRPQKCVASRNMP